MFLWVGGLHLQTNYTDQQAKQNQTKVKHFLLFITEVKSPELKNLKQYMYM